MTHGFPVLRPFHGRGGTGNACIARLAVLAAEAQKERGSAEVIPWSELTPLPQRLSDGQGSPPTATTFVVLGRPIDGEFAGPIRAVCSERDIAEREAESLQLNTQSFVYGVFVQVGESAPRRACSYKSFM